MTLLTINDLVAGYGGEQIVRGVSLAVSVGEMVVLVGPNGAGKSTLVKAVAGLAQVSAGRVEFAGAAVTGQSSARIAARGVAFVPQERNVFRSLSVAENLALGGWLRPTEAAAARAAALRRFPALEAKLATRAGLLSGGERQMLALAAALMARPTLLLLDEPTAGLAPAAAETMFVLLRQLAANGVAILMVEQNAAAALRHADRGYVLASGKVRREGAACELATDPALGELFLGEAA